MGITRRSFLKATAAMGAAATAFSAAPDTLSGLAEAKAEAKDDIKKVRSTCRGCGKFECTVWVTMKNGRPVKIEGDLAAKNSGGNICTKGQSSIQGCFHPDRLLYPMKRTRPKGEEPGWVRISWDEALNTSVKRLQEIKAQYGADAIRLQHGTSRITSYSVQNVVQGMGSVNVGQTAGQICKGPRIWASALTFVRSGSYVALEDGVDCYVQWGGNTEISNYDNSAATTVDRRFKAKKHIVIGPRMQNLGAQADYWLHLRPGTDTAMAMAWMKIVIDSGKYDKEFVTKWSNGPFLYSKDMAPSGFTWKMKNVAETIYPLNISTKLVKESDMVKGGSAQKFAFYDKKSKSIKFFDASNSSWPTDYKNLDVALEGSYDVKLANGKTIKAVTVWNALREKLAPYTPEYTGKICQVDPKLIKEAASSYASFKHGGGILVENGVEHACNAIQNCRSIFMISGLTGNIDTPGGHRCGDDNPDGHVLYIPYNVAPAIPDLPNEKLATRYPGVWKYPLMGWAASMFSAPAFSDLTAIVDMKLTGKPYPIRAVVNMTGTLFQNSNAAKNYEAWKTLDFNLVAEQWMNANTALADIVLPSTHWLETEVIRGSQGAAGVLGGQTGPVKAQGEAWPDPVICVELLKRMNIPYWPKEWGPQWPTMKEMNDNSIKPLKDLLKINNWEEYKAKFQKEGEFDYKKLSPNIWAKYKKYETGGFRHDKQPGFATPTGKFELMSTILESYHPGEEWPVFHEPPYSQYTAKGKEMAKEYPISLITGVRSPVYFHNEHRQLPYCRELHLLPKVQINPDTAAKLGIKNGDWVWIENHKGKVRMTADLFTGIAPDVASADHAWWYPELPGPEYGWRYSNINLLIDETQKDVICGANYLKAFPVKIYKAKEGAPEGIITSVTDPRLKAWMPKFDNGRA